MPIRQVSDVTDGPLTHAYQRRERKVGLHARLQAQGRDPKGLCEKEEREDQGQKWAGEGRGGFGCVHGRRVYLNGHLAAAKLCRGCRNH